MWQKPKSKIVQKPQLKTEQCYKQKIANFFESQKPKSGKMLSGNSQKLNKTTTKNKKKYKN